MEGYGSMNNASKVMFTPDLLNKILEFTKVNPHKIEFDNVIATINFNARMAKRAQARSDARAVMRLFNRLEQDDIWG